MSRQRRIRDETGGSVYYDIDESDAQQSCVGAGVFDVMKNVAAKLTGKAAKRIAEKAAEKLVEKGAEKVGEKTGQLLGEKIYDRFNSKSEQGNRENRGDLIIKELQKLKHNKPKPNHKGELTHPLKGLASRSISEQFDDLLNL